MISRRQLLALGSATAAVAALGAGGTVASWWKQSPAAAYVHLSTAEAGFLLALAEVAWPATSALPLPGHRASLDHFMDGTLGTIPPAIASQLRLLFHALDHLPLATRASTFQDLAPAERGEVLEGWLGSGLAELRSGASSLVVLLGMGYTTHPDNAPWFSRMYGCGYAP